MNENGATKDIDITLIVDDLMPKKWRCPHCAQINSVGEFSNEILALQGKFIAQCERCAHLHFFHLELTLEFIEKTMQNFQKLFAEEKCSQTPMESASEGVRDDAI